MKHHIKYPFIILLFTFNLNFVKAQFNVLISECEKNIGNEYISDGQQYISLITQEQTAEFNTIFYGGNTYRIIACGGSKKDLKFKIFDKDRNELFNNSEFNNTQYWDIQFESTIECFIEAKLSANAGSSGFAVILIGLKIEKQNN